ncbi:gag protease polyprotein [Cucumis melo var. makuwa]|uniref:Gag protease polyprotein n=1 Tax=Cucumis melo var. makuwa TaxID=1194695 RepID=A0A5A7TIT7_CUCMM|nr:gag protease polyprotein [Cucumis melo var. makuwa]
MVVFNPPSVASFKYKGTGTVVLPKIISALKVSMLLNHGTWSILASVVDTRESEVSLSSESVVREYPYHLSRFSFTQHQHPSFGLSSKNNPEIAKKKVKFKCLPRKNENYYG